MELIVISDHKLKIMLTAPDMKRYALDAQQLDYASNRTRDAFRHIFSDARKQYDFKTDGSRLFIQLFASNDGGCEIFVTRLDTSAAPVTRSTSATAREGQRTFPHLSSALTHGEKALLQEVYEDAVEDQPPYDNELSSSIPTAFRFDTPEALLSVCRRLLRDGYRDRSTVYIVEGEGASRWYLVLYLQDSFDDSVPMEYAYIDEYGDRLSPDRLLPYVSEYGRVLRDTDAVAVFGRL